MSDTWSWWARAFWADPGYDDFTQPQKRTMEKLVAKTATKLGELNPKFWGSMREGVAWTMRSVRAQNARKEKKRGR